MSLNFLCLGVGEGGGKISAAMVPDGCNVGCINTNKNDLQALTSVQESKKLLLDIGQGGTGKDPLYVKSVLEKNGDLKNNIVNFIKGLLEATPLYSSCPHCHKKNKIKDSEAIGEYHVCDECGNKFGITEINKEEKIKHDYILLFVSLGGGSGSGTILAITDICCEYFNIPVGVIASIPSDDEDSVTKGNAMSVFKDLYNDYAVKELISPLILIDNEKMLKTYNLPVGKAFTVINRVVARSINSFNSFSNQVSNTGITLDTMDTVRLMSLGGCATLGKFIVGSPKSESSKYDYKVPHPLAIEEINDAMEQCFFVNGFDLHSAKGVGVVAVAPEYFMEDENISTCIKYVFNKIKEIIGDGLIFKGQYTDQSVDCLEFYIFYNGLKFPQDRFAKMWQDIKEGKAISQRKNERIDEVSYEIEIETGNSGKAFKKIQEMNIGNTSIVKEQTKEVPKQNKERKPCTNCWLDPVSKVSIGVYKKGGPQPFTSKICPICGGSGKI